jgi:localization factor PodJL
LTAARLATQTFTAEKQPDDAINAPINGRDWSRDKAASALPPAKSAAGKASAAKPDRRKAAP